MHFCTFLKLSSSWSLTAYETLYTLAKKKKFFDHTHESWTKGREEKRRKIFGVFSGIKFLSIVRYLYFCSTTSCDYVFSVTRYKDCGGHWFSFVFVSKHVARWQKSKENRSKSENLLRLVNFNTCAGAAATRFQSLAGRISFYARDLRSLAFRFEFSWHGEILSGKNK